MAKTIYLDNAATTAVHKDVAAVISGHLTSDFGNPSSIHHLGRKSRAIIEQSRKAIARNIGAQPSEIIFTSGGTEADNMAINHAVNALGVQHIISSNIEHSAVINTNDYYSKKNNLQLHLIEPNSEGLINAQMVEERLQSIPKEEKVMVSLMHTNNEIGNITDIQSIGALKEKFSNLYLHSDTVQAFCYTEVSVSELNVDFLACSGHKIHGPKGVGFLYASSAAGMSPLIRGGGQERGYRGGTEPIAAIAGLAKAFELLESSKEEQNLKFNTIHEYAVEQLKAHIEGIKFNSNLNYCSPTILNVQLPSKKDASMLLFNYDLAGICVSGGSACASGSNKGSHVLEAIGSSSQKPSIRISFSPSTTHSEIDQFIAVTKEII